MGYVMLESEWFKQGEAAENDFISWVFFIIIIFSIITMNYLV